MTDHIVHMARNPGGMFPLSMGLFAWQSGMVFLTCGAKLFSDPQAGTTLQGMITEKQKAFTDGAMAAGRAAMTGASPQRIAAAGMAPARKRVRANMAKLHK